MLNKIWEALSSLRLTFWILLVCVALFFVGSFYAGSNFAFFENMNEMTLQKWVLDRGVFRPGIIWWLPLLIAALFLLGVNTFCCSIKRVMQLWSQRAVRSRKAFLVRLSPSLVHCFFLIILFGHCLTSLAGSWDRYPVEEGQNVHLDGPNVTVTVQSVTRHYYDSESLMNGRLSQIDVVLSQSNGETTSLSFLNPASLGPYHLHLDMIKKRPLAEDKKPVRIISDETCNKEEVYRRASEDEQQKLFLLVIRDPGIYLIMTGFLCILSLMGWYFIEINRGQGKNNNRPGGDALG